MAGYRRASDDFDDDLAHGDAPRNRWDRSRFERAYHDQQARHQPPPLRREVLVQEREPERDRYYEQPRFVERVHQEIYNDYNPEISDRQLMPYRPRDNVREIIIERRREEPAPPRPRMLRRQSSFETYFDQPPPRRTVREVEIDRYETHSPPHRAFREEGIEITRRTEERHEEKPRSEAHDEVKEVEIIKEKEIIIRPKSDARSVLSGARSVRSATHSQVSRVSSSSSSSESTIASVPVKLPGKKGHTKLPKSQFKRHAVQKFGVDFEEDDNFFIIKRGLDKHLIDQILEWSREEREPRVRTYRFDGDRLEESRTRYEKVKTEWINPPSVRAPSPPAPPREMPLPPPAPVAPIPVQETITITQQTGPGPAPPPVVVTPQFIPPPPLVQPMTVAVAQRTERTHQDIDAEIRHLEREREIIRLERQGFYAPPQVIVEPPRPQVIMEQPQPLYVDYQVAEYAPRGRERVVEFVEAKRSKSKGRSKSRGKANQRMVNAMLATLT